MESSMQLSWNTVERLVPIVLEYAKKYKSGQKLGVSDALEAFDKVDQELHVRDSVRNKVEELLKQGLAYGLGPDGTQMAELLAGMSEEVFDLIVDCLKDGSPKRLERGLDEIMQNASAGLESQLVQMLGIPQEAADFLVERLGGLALSLYLFAAAYKIYARAARDAEIARQHRIEVEAATQEAVAELAQAREELDAFLDEYMLDRLLPFQGAMEAIDEAVVAGDDDGYIKANAQLWALFGRRSQYVDKDGFDELMRSDTPFVL